MEKEELVQEKKIHEFLAKLKKEDIETYNKAKKILGFIYRDVKKDFFDIRKRYDYWKESIDYVPVVESAKDNLFKYLLNNFILFLVHFYLILFYYLVFISILLYRLFYFLLIYRYLCLWSRKNYNLQFHNHHYNNYLIQIHKKLMPYNHIFLYYNYYTNYHFENHNIQKNYSLHFFYFFFIYFYYLLIKIFIISYYCIFFHTIWICIINLPLFIPMSA